MPAIFHCKIESPDDVYDGDTIKDVHFRSFLPELGIGHYIVRDLRINGIDTPEKHPKKSGRSLRSINREKRASEAARQAVIEILQAYGYEFDVHNLKGGKYYGRVVGTVIIGEINLAQHLIRLGHAKAYFGGHKPEWNF